MTSRVGDHFDRCLHTFSRSDERRSRRERMSRRGWLTMPIARTRISAHAIEPNRRRGAASSAFQAPCPSIGVQVRVLSQLDRLWLARVRFPRYSYVDGART
jgi:hypothetical protein